MTHQDPTPQTTKKTIIINIMIVVVIVVLAPLLTVGVIWWQTGALPTFSDAQPPQIPPDGTLETVVLSPNSTDSVTAADSYSGQLVLVMEGSVPAADVGLRDVFYKHTDEFSLPIDSPVLAQPLLNINGEPVKPLPYNPFHIYHIPYMAESPRQPMTFSLNTEHTAPSDTRQIRVFITQPDR